MMMLIIRRANIETMVMMTDNDKLQVLAMIVMAMMTNNDLQVMAMMTMMTDNDYLQVIAMSPLFRPKASVCSLLYLDMMMMMMRRMMTIMTLMMLMMIMMTFIPPDSLVTCKVVILSISLALGARYLN